MRNLIVGIVLAVGLFASGANAATPHVKVELLADVSAVTAGKPFWLGVHLSVDPGWHVYWKNPGDAGLPTEVKLSLPPGFTAGPLVYPTPQRFDQPGGIVALGYEHSLLLMEQVTPPAELSSDFIGEFSADVSWLVCSDVCVPGKDTVNLSLGSSATAGSANAELFDFWKPQVPLEVSQSPDVAAIHTGGEMITTDGRSSGRFVLEVDWKSAVPDGVAFLPGSLDIYNVLDAKVESEGNKTRITFRLETLAGKSPDPATMESVVGYKNSDGVRRGVVAYIHLPHDNGDAK